VNSQYKSFMDQFPAAKKEVAELRRTMGDSAKVAILTYPSRMLEAQALATARPKKKP
jgi:hypothetical protein